MFKKIILFVAIFTALLTTAVTNAADQHAGHHQHGNMLTSKTPLTEAGNDAFATLQEALQQLQADPNTDWSKVNMEALRQHLVDMRNFTMGVDVNKQTPIQNGVEVLLTPDNEKVAASLDRVFSAHPGQLKRETGWDMKTIKQNKQYKIIITTDKPSEVKKIQGLGYIGVMAWGNHHQPHHWMMVKGGNPH